MDQLFTLHKRFEPLHERLIPIGSVRIDCCNNIYLATQKRIYVVCLKRLLDDQDWIQDILTLKKMLNIEDNGKATYEPKSSDPITVQFNQEKRDRVSQIDFLRFAIADQGIPILRSDLIAQRLVGLNGATDMLSFRSFQVHPYLPSTLAFVLNNGDAYEFRHGQSISLNDMIGPVQVTSLVYSGAFILGLSHPHCVMAIAAGTAVYFLHEGKVVERVELQSQVVQEQILLRVEERKSSRDPIVLQCVALLASEKITSIRVTLSLEFECLERKLNSIEVMGCFGIHWLSQHSIGLQQGDVFFAADIDNLKNLCIVLPFGVLSKLVHQKNGIYLMQDGSVFNTRDNSRFGQKELFSISGVDRTISAELYVIGGQPDVTQQRKGSFTIQWGRSNPLELLVCVFKRLLSTVTVNCLRQVVAYTPINFDDVGLLLQRDTSIDVLDLIRTCFALLDPKTFTSKHQVKIDMVNEHQMQANEIGRHCSDTNVREFCAQVMLLNMLLLGKERKLGWDEIYLASYARYIRCVEESVRITLKTVKLAGSTHQRLEAIHRAIVLQIGILSSQLQQNITPPQQSTAAIRQYAEQLQHLPWVDSGPAQQQCPYCKAALAKDHWTQCAYQHRFLRCNATMEPLHEQRILRCGVCRFQYGEVVGLPKEIFCMQANVCPVCCGHCSYIC